MELSILLPIAARRNEQLLPFAALVEWTHARRLWQGQALLPDTFQSFTAAAAAGFRVPSAIGVALTPLRHPFALAHEAATVASATGHEVLLGIGPGARNFQLSMLGSPYPSPLNAIREYHSVLRGLFNGDTVTVAGEYFTCHGALARLPTPPVLVGFGVLRPRMAELAGELADFVCTWLTPPSYLDHELRNSITSGMKVGNRTIRPRVVAMTPFAVARDGRDQRELVLISNAAHLGAPPYQDMLKKAGVDVDRGRDRLVDGVLDSRAFCYGRSEEIVEQLAAYERAGVDELVLNATGVASKFGAHAAIEDLREVLTRWSERA